MVKVYSFDGCPWCDKVKKFLDAKGIEYEVRDVEEDDQAAAECQKISGDLTVPVTTVDGVNYVLGFNKPELEKLLGIA
ncbi:MAG: glutaredoxin family protein [Selenomonadaceae bacterium]|nr:glutaredoxin family protein [Selenomonadaceae bacterium]